MALDQTSLVENPSESERTRVIASGLSLGCEMKKREGIPGKREENPIVESMIYNQC